MSALESLFQAFPYPAAVLDTKGQITLVNSMWSRLSRRSMVPDLYGEVNTEYMALCRQAAAKGWEAAAQLISGLRSVSAGAKPSFSLDYRSMENDLEQWFRLTASALPDGGMLVIQDDITSIRHTASHLQRLTTAVSAAANAIVITNHQGIIEWINPAFTQLTGYTEAEAVGQHTRLLKSGKENDAFYENLWRTILAGKTWEGTLINRRKDGSDYHERMSITPIKNASGIVTHYIAIKEDVSKSVQQEKVLREERAFFKNIVEHIPIQIFVKDATALSYVRVNAALEKQLGLSREEMIGKTDYDFWPREQADFFVQKDREVLASGEPLNIPEEPISLEDGETRWLHTQKIPIVTQDGTPAYLLGISEDISERKRQERELIEAKERAESASQIKSRLLHELNHEMRTPLTSIIGFAENLIEHGSQEDIEQAQLIYQSGLRLLELFETTIGVSEVVSEDDAAIETPPSAPAAAPSAPLRQDKASVAAPPTKITQADVEVRRRLLVVDDDYITRRLMERALSHKFDVVPRESYGTALETITAEAFDACLFDIDLDNGQTGIELLYELRDVPGYEHVPVIACTAHVMTGARARFLSAGFQGYVAKPFTKKRLEESLEAVFDINIDANEGAADLDISLPPPPPMLMETVRLLNASTKDADIESLTRLVNRDPVAAAWVLRHVNSGYFNLSRRVTRIGHGVKMLGFKPVCNLLLGGVLSHAFAEKSDPVHKKVHSYIHALSITTAALARHVAEAVAMGKDEQEILVTGSLLHQLGRMIMLEMYSSRYTDLWRVRSSTAQWSEITEPSRGQEFLAFETDYVRLGAQAARTWHLGDPIYTMIGTQQRPRALAEGRMQHYVLVMAISRVAATTLLDKTTSFPGCFKIEPARRRLHRLGTLLNLAPEEILGYLEEAMGSSRSLLR